MFLIKHNGATHRVKHAASNFEVARVCMSTATNCRHPAADRGGRVRHRAHDRYFIMLTTTGGSELLLQIACRHGSRNGNKQALCANFRSDLLQHLRHGLGLYGQQNDVSAFDRFAIVGGDGNL